MKKFHVITLGVVVILYVIPPFSLAEEKKPGRKTTPHEHKVYEVHIPKGTDKFVPSVLRIKVGDTVVWINEDDRAHPVASVPGKGTNDKELYTDPIPPGKSWSHTFNKPGEYPYFCYIHYWMMGVVFVENGQTGGQSQKIEKKAE